MAAFFEFCVSSNGDVSLAWVEQALAAKLSEGDNIVISENLNVHNNAGARVVMETRENMGYCNDCRLVMAGFQSSSQTAWTGHGALLSLHYRRHATMFIAEQNK